MLAIGAWGGLELVERIEHGNRNEVWRATRNGDSFSVRRSRRSEASLRWELDLIDLLAHNGFLVPTVVATDDGRLHDGGVVVQRWIDGREPKTTEDWDAVANELQRLHILTADHGQRPGCCITTELRENRVSGDADLDAVPPGDRAVIEAVLTDFVDAPTAVVHGDPGPSNLRITAADRVALLDWDESRVDVTWHDLSNLAVRVLAPDQHRRAVDLSDAWEAVNGWCVEPVYAAQRLANLRRRRADDMSDG